MKVNRLILPIFTIKLVTITMSLEQSKEDGQISNLQSNTYNMVKTGPVDPEITR